MARASDAVREDRLWARLMRLAEIGRTPAGGVNRPALSAEDHAAKLLVAGWAAQSRFSVSTDAIGNLFIRRAGDRPDLEPVLTGSHMDTQPTGGRFEGAFGVIAALEVLEALEDAVIRTERPVEVVAWTNEEGCRFQPGCMGSAAFAGKLALSSALAATDEAGVSVAQALSARAGKANVASVELARPMAAYVEAHIEQGPVLEAEHRSIGVVTGIQGTRWFVIDVEGEAGHAGTTPMHGRKDALAVAVRIVHAMRELVDECGENVRFTVGRLNVRPNSPNTIPSRVVFTVDIRSTDEGLLEHLSSDLTSICSSQASPCVAHLKETFRTAPRSFDADVQAVIESAARSLGFPAMRIVSGAFHDALFMADHCPSAMIFVPCRNGISHNEAESAEPADLVAGTKVLADVVVSLANG